MANEQNKRFPQQEEPVKHHGLHGSEADRDYSGSDASSLNTSVDREAEERAGKEKYLRDIAKPEDAPGNGGEPVDENSVRFTDKSGEEKKEEYINTEERKADIERTIQDQNKKRR